MVSCIIQIIIQTRRALGLPKLFLGPCSLGTFSGLLGPSLVRSLASWAFSCVSEPLGLGRLRPGPWAFWPQKPMTAAKLTNDSSQRKHDSSKTKKMTAAIIREMEVTMGSLVPGLSLPWASLGPCSLSPLLGLPWFLPWAPFLAFPWTAPVSTTTPS